MNAYEEILGLMRNEGKKDNTAPIQIGVMQDAEKCRLGKLVLSKDDMMVAQHIAGTLKQGDTVAVYRMSDELYLLLERLVRI